MDDEEDVAFVFGEALKSRGYPVDIFSDACAAYEKIKSEHQNYLLVLTDVRMLMFTHKHAFNWCRSRQADS